MARPAINWLITDTHFFHDACKDFCNRPDNYNELIIKNLRRLVSEQDTLYHLGDVIFYQHPKLKPMLDSVPGRKFLVMGNHDHKSRGWYSRNGFDGVFDSVQVGEVLLSHKPMQSWPDGTRLNIHGHWHNDDHRAAEMYREWYDPERYRLLAIENTDYKPVNMAQFIEGSS